MDRWQCGNKGLFVDIWFCMLMLHNSVMNLPPFCVLVCSKIYSNRTSYTSNHNTSLIGREISRGLGVERKLAPRNRLRWLFLVRDD